MHTPPDDTADPAQAAEPRAGAAVEINPLPADVATKPWLVACLCAEWCGTCRGYRAVLEALARQHADVRCAWIDIEDQSDALGGLDIEDFPTVLIAHNQSLRFFGTLLPHAATLDRSLDAARRAPLTAESAMPPGLFAQVLTLADRCLV